MQLTELDPRLQDGVLVFNCPCAKCLDIRAFPEAERNKLYCDSRIRLNVSPTPLQGAAQPCWLMTGTFPDTISLTPSIRIGGTLGGKCDWHGYLTNGEMKPC